MQDLEVFLTSLLMLSSFAHRDTEFYIQFIPSYVITEVHYANVTVSEMSVEASSPAESVEPYVKDEAVDNLIMAQEPVKEEHQSKWPSLLQYLEGLFLRSFTSLT